MRTDEQLKETIRDTSAPGVDLDVERQQPPPGRGWIWAIAALLVGALVVGTVFVWQRSERDDAVAAVTLERDAALERVAMLKDRIDALRAEVAGVGSDVRALRGELRAARAELESMLGPALPDGRHFGRLVAVGETQEPPRLVIDIEQWFTDDEALQAAIEDGAVPPDWTAVENDFYIRNENPRWRVIEVDPAAPVSLTTYPYGDIDDPRVVSLARFGELFASGEGYLPSFPYWIIVRDGIVTAIEEQFVP
jgi:hypothetical protein